MADEPNALQRVAVELPRKLRVPRRTTWALRQFAEWVLLFAAMPLVSRIPLVIPFIPGWVGLVGLIVFGVWWFMRRFRVSVRDMQDTTVMLRGGSLEAAQPRLEQALSRASGVFAPQFAVMLGSVDIVLGDSERALAILESARASGWFGRNIDRVSRANLHANLAAAHAELGDDATAFQELEVARRELPAEQRGMLLADEVHVLARAGRHVEVRELVARDLDAAEQILPAWGVKWIRVLHAFSSAAGGIDYRVAAEDDVRALLADTRVSSSILRLAARWPELATFLSAHGVSARA